LTGVSAWPPADSMHLHCVCNSSFLSVLVCIKVHWRHHDNVMFEMAAPRAPVPGVAKGAPPSPKRPQPRVRVEFPETWLWSESNTGYHLTASVIYATQFNSCEHTHVETVPIPSCRWLAFLYKKKFTVLVFVRYLGPLFQHITCVR